MPADDKLPGLDAVFLVHERATAARPRRETAAGSLSGMGGQVTGVESRLSWDELDKRLGATTLSTNLIQPSGLVVKRTVAERSTEMAPVVQDTHVVVVHNNEAINLQWSDGRRIRRSVVAPGYVIVNPAGHLERRGWDGRSEDVRIGIALDSVHLGDPPPELRPAIGVHDPLLAQLGRYLARTVEMGASEDSLYVDALAHALGAHLVEHYSNRPTARQSTAPTTPSPYQLEEVRDYIEANLHRQLTITELAGVANIGPAHFTRLFRQHTGEPPYRYVLRRRLERAEKLIVGSRLPLAVIASTVGFSDQSHLNRVMRVHRGVTPGQLRRRTASTFGGVAPTPDCPFAK